MRYWQTYNINLWPLYYEVFCWVWYENSFEKAKETQKLKEKENFKVSYILVACLKWAAFVKSGVHLQKNFWKHSGFEAYIMSKNCALAVDILVYNNHELDRILKVRI